jgi:phage/plasmid-like protein (TIGR03299 family)
MELANVEAKELEAVVPDKVAVIREDDGRYLGTVGRTRGILQYRDVLAFTESLVDEGTASYVTGGVLGNGEQAFVVMKTNKQIVLSAGDEVDCYFYVTTSHDSSKGLEIVLAPLRKANGTVLSTPKDCRIRFKHSRRVEARVKAATLSINKLSTYFEDMETSFRLLRGVNLTIAQRDVFFKSLFPDPDDRTKHTERIRTEITDIYNGGAACQLPATKGTMLGAYMAVVEWVDKIRNVKQSKRRPNEYDAKLHSILEGSGAQQKADAYAFALDMVAQLGNISIFGNEVSDG